MSRGDLVKRSFSNHHEPELIYSKGRLPQDWRWRIANGTLRLVTGHAAAERDPYVTNARKFFRDLTENGKDISGLANRYPAIREAYLIETENGLHKWYLQALIIAHASHIDISARTDLEISTVEWYEKLFYDVGNILGNGFKFIKLVPNAVGGVILKTDHDPLWKMVAFSGGVTMLDALVTPGPIGDNAVNWFRSASRGASARNQFIAETGREINRHTQRFILEQAIETRKVEIVAQSNNIDTGDSDSKSRHFLGNLTMAVASVLDPERTTNDEPRDYELIDQLMLPAAASNIENTAKPE